MAGDPVIVKDDDGGGRGGGGAAGLGIAIIVIIAVLIAIFVWHPWYPNRSSIQNSPGRSSTSIHPAGGP